MKLNYLISVLVLFSIEVSAQEQCATMEVLKTNMEKDPSLREKMVEMEEELMKIMKSRGTFQYNYDQTEKANNNFIQKTQKVTSLCGNDNTYFSTIAAPTTLNQIVSPSPNCTFGGEYVAITNLIAGRMYRISLCGLNNFDTQLTIYSSTGNAVAHNDDWCGTQSEIYFTPISSGNYNILVDAYNCASNALCASLAVELWNIPRPKITIPVVVHVIHCGEAIGTGRNISVNQINSQISVLNKDFRRLNTDISQIPAAFRGWSADPRIEFCLAQQDEFGTPTTGIVRYFTSNTQITQNDMETSIKPATIWDRDYYLNIWVIDFGASSTTLGYAQFPGNAANTDGVVIRYTAFGSMGNVQTPYNLGRTTTHEVGHWLNLRHIWGDDTDCSGSDFITDTPNQEFLSSGTPSFPILDNCSPNYPGIMFYNYMDYSNDATTSMFTYGQFARMDAALFGPRLSLQNSIGCFSSVGIIENDLDKRVDVYPNPSSGIVKIKFKENIKAINVTVLDPLGQEINNWNFSENSEEFTFDLVDLNNGIYFLKITANEQVVVRKLILTK